MNNFIGNKILSIYYFKIIINYEYNDNKMRTCINHELTAKILVSHLHFWTQVTCRLHK